MTELMPRFPTGSSAIVLSALCSAAMVEEVGSVVSAHFPKSVDQCCAMSPQAYHQLVAAAQDDLNRRQFARRIAEDRRDALAGVLGSADIMIQTNVYLRATRPGPVDGQEFVDWHRESFYGPGMNACVNVWVPIAGVTPRNTLRYVPESHLIPDDAIYTEQSSDPSVARFSEGHRIGLLYAPKRIVRGVDVAKSKPMIVPYGTAAIFSGNLIHGAAANPEAGIRFSVDFRALAAENLSVEKRHFASGKAYLESL